MIVIVIVIVTRKESGKREISQMTRRKGVFNSRIKMDLEQPNLAHAPTEVYAIAENQLKNSCRLNTDSTVKTTEITSQIVHSA